MNVKVDGPVKASTVSGKMENLSRLVPISPPWKGPNHISPRQQRPLCGGLGGHLGPRGGEGVAAERRHGGCGGLGSVWGSDSCGRVRLVSGGDGGVLVRLGATHPPAVLLLLPLHAPILEPDFDVALGEAQGQRELHAAGSRDVAVKQELLLELEQLRARVGRPSAFVFLRFRHHI